MMKTALTIAGSDSSGGAGIQADLKTMIANGVYGMSAITALTAQNTTGVQGIFEVTPEFLEQEIDSVFTDIRPDAVKIGMVSSAGLIKSIGEDPQFLAVDSEQSDKHLTICFGQISDGVDPVAPQSFCGGSSNIEKFRRWQGPDLLLEGRFRDFCYGIRFLHIGSQLGENLIEADPDRYGKPYFFLYCLSDLVGYLGRCLMCQKGRAGELDPTLIDAEGLHFRGIPQIDCTHNPGKLQVLIHVRRDDR